jgi:hypothetical protein
MTTSDYDPESQAERRRVLQNDARVREQSRNGDTSSYLDHVEPLLGGRFAVTEHQTITGVVSPSPPPLPTNSPWHGSDPVPDEPPLGYRIDAMPEQESSMAMWSSSIEATGPASADAPSLSDSASLGDAQRAGAGPSSSQTGTRLGGPGGLICQPCPTVHDERAGPPSNKDDGNG